MEYYLAIDIGASSGRHILGARTEEGLKLREIYRFTNGMEAKDGHLVWNYERLVSEILAGMKKCTELGMIPKSVGIDTWGVDFVLLDSEDRVLGDMVGYRDERTKGMDTEVFRTVSEEELYGRTGIFSQSINSVYQLMAVKKEHPEMLDAAKAILFVPDYLQFRLCGAKVNEYSEASTSGLISPKTKDWDFELITRLGLPKEMFRPIVMAGTKLGTLLPEVAREVGFTCDVVTPCTHDTGSAVLAVPYEHADEAFISSGTWSLFGMERETADCSEESRKCGFTNEGGFGGSVTYIRNIMGLWMIQSVRHELKDAFSFAELCDLAEASDIDSLVDCQDECFMAPASMTEALKNFCARTGQRVPETPGELARVVYRSLADCYRKTVAGLEERTGIPVKAVHVVGGGSKAAYLNRLTEEFTGRKVTAGPSEATAIGNLLSQMLGEGVFSDLSEARKYVSESRFD